MQTAFGKNDRRGIALNGELGRTIHTRPLWRFRTGLITWACDLIGPRRFFHWNVWAWCTVLSLAERHGWVPEGTGPRRRSRAKKRDVNGYFSNDGHLVYARDAKKLAAAIDAFLAAAEAGRARCRVDEAWFWTRPGRKALRDFAAFCRKGSFRIF
jgi:hypothetical protein